jgi:hypothetical protein
LLSQRKLKSKNLSVITEEMGRELCAELKLDGYCENSALTQEGLHESKQISAMKYYERQGNRREKARER